MARQRVRLVKDVSPGVSFSYLNGLTAVGNTLYFIAYDAITGYELWKSDGTTAGTIQAMDLNPGRASGASQILDERMGLI